MFCLNLACLSLKADGGDEALRLQHSAHLYRFHLTESSHRVLYLGYRFSPGLEFVPSDR